ncbi:MAG: SIR2 family protein, partial [Bifidobacteriaceae bacterium]|nr:SIR2 family protein [Bifidobacteriaceae bacterium]
MASLDSLFSAYAGNEAVFGELAETVRAGRVKPFVGAGMSARLYPMWGQALQQMAVAAGSLASGQLERIEANAARGAYEQAAADLANWAGAEKWAAVISEAFGERLIDDDVLAGLPVSLLPQVFPTGPVLTTNFDRVLERVYGPGFGTVIPDFPDSPHQRGATIRDDPPCLVKIHGCVSAPDRLVLTRRGYVDAYGEDFDTPNADYLKHLLTGRAMLFLGCGLAQDRTMELLKKIAGKYRTPHYAVAEMPGAVGSEEFSGRARELSNSGIRPIWYPKGEHGYVETVLRGLIDAAGVVPGSAMRPPPGAPGVTLARGFMAPPVEDCIGRDAVIEAVRELVVDAPGRHAVEVIGGPGIGKSTVCRQVLGRLAGEGLPVADVDLSGLSGKAQALTAIVREFAGAGAASAEPLESQIERLAREAPGLVLYLDNLEDPLADPEFREWLLDFAPRSGWRVLWSTRTRVTSSKVRSRQVEELDPADARKLFGRHWEGRIAPEEEEPLAEFLKSLDHHTLSIVLVACQHYRLPTVAALAGEWEADRDHDGMETDDAGRQGSLRRSIRLSYEAVQHCPEAVELWAVMAYIPSALPDGLFDLVFQSSRCLFSRFSPRKHRAAAALLCRHSLLQATPSGFRMLSPLRDMVFAFDGRESVSQRARGRLENAYVTVLARANDRKRGDRLVWHHLAVECMPGILALLDRTMTEGGSIDALARAAYNHWFYATGASVRILRRIVERRAGSQHTRARIYERLGDLEWLLGNDGQARASYREAERLCREQRDDLGLANTLLGLGDLELALGDHGQARANYDEAGRLFREQGDDLGLANTLLGLGDLEL